MVAISNIIRTLRIRSSVEGADKTRSDLKGIADAHQNVTRVTDTSSRGQLSLADSVAKAERRFNSSIRALQDFEKVQRQMNLAVAQNPALQARANAVIEAARKHFDLTAQSQRGLTGAANDNAKAFERLGNMLVSRFIYGAILTQTARLIPNLIALNTELAKTGDIAARIGTSGAALQGLMFAGAIKGVTDMPVAMLAFNKQVEMARAGLGDLAVLFRANGLQVRDTEDAFLKVADLVKSAASEARKFAIAEQAGLPSTREMIRVLEQGADAIRKTSAEARKFTDEQLKRAQEIDDKWNESWASFTRWGKAAILEVADFPKEGSPLRDLMDMASGKKPFSIKFDFKAEPGSALDLLQRQGALNAPVIPVERHDLPPPAQSTRLTVNGRTTVDPARLKELLGLEQQRIGVLGQMATVEQQVRTVEIGIELARLNNVKVTRDEENALVALARAQAIGITQIRAQVDALRIEGATLGMSVGEAAAYRAVWEKVAEARRAGHPLNEQQIRDLETEAAELKKIADQNENMRQLTELGMSFASSMLDAAMNSRSLNEGLKMSLDSLSKMAANAALKNLLEGKWEMAAIDTAIAIGSKLAGGLFDDSDQKALDEAKKSWAGMCDALAEFIVASAKAIPDGNSFPAAPKSLSANDNQKEKTIDCDQHIAA